MDVAEVERVRYIDYSYWVELSGGSRRPADVPATLERAEQLPSWLLEIGTDWCFELAEVIKTNGVVGDLIIVGTPDLADLVILEGHARLTALFVSGLQGKIPVTAYVGTSPNIQTWRLF